MIGKSSQSASGFQFFEFRNKHFFLWAMPSALRPTSSLEDQVLLFLSPHWEDTPVVPAITYLLS
jgi:hypothetical protein